MSSKRVAGVLLTVLSAIGILYSIFTISNDTSGLIGYTYSAPFTTHETTILTTLGVSVVVLIIGLVLLLSKDN